MTKMNKKGFTLIEMLVVIAIIAVLVSIIIPTVSSATGKAKAATDAANLRSMLAEATTDYLNGQADDTGLVKMDVTTSGTATTYTFSGREGAPKCSTNENWPLSITVDSDGIFTAKYGDYTLANFQEVAENGGALAADAE